MLLQEQDGGLHPVRYASRVVTAAQRRYFDTKQGECMGIVFALETFRDLVLAAVPRTPRVASHLAVEQRGGLR